MLTLDYTLKMLNIHERRECGIPVIVQGETGVGKTALIEMLSKLWNNSWHNQWERRKSSMLLDNVMKKLEGNATGRILSYLLYTKYYYIQGMSLLRSLIPFTPASNISLKHQHMHLAIILYSSNLASMVIYLTLNL